MGQAKRRGSFEERKQSAINRNTNALIEKMGGRDDRVMAHLRTGIEPFLSKVSKRAWLDRRELIIESLKVHPESTGLEKAKPIRVREDEIGWYLFLCEQTLENPLCVDSAQAQRILPFFVAIGERWSYAPKVDGLQRKIREALSHYKAAPDGTIFEILVALSYAAKGWNVEFLREKPPAKSPDMVVRKGDIELFVECKRLERRTEYAEKERKEFLRIWDAAVPLIKKNKQWIWLKVKFHTEVSNLPTDFLAQILEKNLPIKSNETILHESVDATISARYIDRQAVKTHLDHFMVKNPSPMLTNLLGGDWAPENSEATVVCLAKSSRVKNCEVPVLGTYLNDIGWACGITRIFDCETSISKKARDITKLLSKAEKQLPQAKASIIHIAAETLEGRHVERRRSEKVESKIRSFLTNKNLLEVRFHRFQSNSRTELLYEIDETIDTFAIDGAPPIKDIPSQTVVPEHVEMVNGPHWEIYD